MSSDVQELQISIDTARKLSKDYDALERLYKNRDFIHLIENKFFKEEPVRITHLLSHPNFASEEKRADLFKELDVIAGFVAFLRGVNQAGEGIRDQIAGYEREQELARQETLE